MEKTPAEDRSSMDDEAEVMRIRMRHQEAVRAGMSNAQAVAYANDPTSFPGCGQDELSAASCGTAQSDSDEGNESVAVPLSPKPALSGLSENTGDHEKRDAECLVQDPDCAISQVPPAQSSKVPSECASHSPSDAENERSREPNDSALGNSTEDKVRRDRLSNGRWATGVSGNPKGRKPKNPSNDLDYPSALEQALEKQVKLNINRGEKKKQTLNRRTLILEQWITKAANGDLAALRLLIAYADKRGIDLFAGDHEAIRRGIAAAAAGSSAYILSEEVLDRLSPSTLDEIREVMEEIEAQKKNSKTMH
jgi:hypothetical protein